MGSGGGSVGSTEHIQAVVRRELVYYRDQVDLCI